jgi:Kef-type K+ transport system membrane component KefB
MKKEIDSNTSKALQVIVCVVCVSILALLVYLRVFCNAVPGKGGESLTNRYLITFYGFGFILFGALSVWAFIDLVEKRAKRGLTISRLLLLCIGFAYFLYKLFDAIA